MHHYNSLNILFQVFTFLCEFSEIYHTSFHLKNHSRKRKLKKVRIIQNNTESNEMLHKQTRNLPEKQNFLLLHYFNKNKSYSSQDETSAESGYGKKETSRAKRPHDECKEGMTGSQLTQVISMNNNGSVSRCILAPTVGAEVCGVRAKMLLKTECIPPGVELSLHQRKGWKLSSSF